MSRSERLLDILQSLRGRRQPVTAAALAAEFAVSERSIYRDIASLQRRGARIEGAAGFGYIMREGQFLPPLMFDPTEADAIMLGLRFVIRRGDADLSSAARRAAAKVAAVMPPDLARLSDMTGLIVAPADGPVLQAMSAIRLAIRSERKLRTTYRDADDAVTERTLWPVAIGFFEDGEMLAAWCEARSSFRHFRLDRMTAVSLADTAPPVPHRTLLSRYALIEKAS